jgi:hypothetical protein
MATQHYLTRYAEPETALLQDFTGRYDHVLCIPAFAEDPAFLDHLLTYISSQSLLIILVANAPAIAPEEKLTMTRALVDHLHLRYPERRRFADNLRLLKISNHCDLLLVARCTPGCFLDEKGGVGLARKIACDMACSLIANGTIASPWIYTTDADAQLPADYFSATFMLDQQAISAATYPFQHAQHPDNKIYLAQQLYDTSLHYYVAGLAWANSPWAFHTIGSTLVINADHYASVRGFPKRQAGEDFYLLNKLAKLGCIASLDTSPITLASRLSDRVPFGTGPALSKIIALEDPPVEYLFYNPLCFCYLKAWHNLAASLWENKVLALKRDWIDTFLRNWSDGVGIDADVLMRCLESSGIQNALDHAFSHSKNKIVFDRHLRNWFDAFQTLKFIHWLRDNHLPSLPLAPVQDLAPFIFDSTLDAE